MTQQGDRQASVRAITGTSLTYEGDFTAMFDGAGIAAGDFDGRLLAWINKQLGVSYTEINSAMQAYAATFGAANWSSLGSLDPYPGATAALDFMGPAASGLPFYKLNGLVYTALSSIPGWTFTRASSATAPTSATDPTLQTFGSGVPRVVPGLGILLEEARTNSFLNSAVGVTQAVTTTAASWTLSFYGTGSTTLSGGATGTLNGTGANNRVSLTVTAAAASTTLTVSGSCTNVQFELGASATSYIPTTGATATRAADVPTITGLTAPSSYTLVASATAIVGGANPRLLEFDDGTSSNRAALYSAAGLTGSMVVSSGGVAQADISGGAVTLGQTLTVAGRVDLNNFGVSRNGGAVATDISGSMPVTPTTLYLGNASSNQPLNGFLRRAMIYPTAYSDAQLQAASQ